jgi:uncharacterized protein YacL (UPF0231 family)
MTTNLNSRIQKLEAKLNPNRRNVEPLYLYNEQNIEDALKCYDESEKLNCKIEDVKSWHKQIMKDFVMYFPPSWCYEDYINSQLNRKPTIDLSKLSNEEIKELIEKYDPIFEQMEEAIERERNANRSNVNYTAI